MSAGKHDSAGASCPYWEAKDRQSVYCEGISDDSRLRLSFAGPSGRKEYSKRFCCSDKNWKRCRIAQMLEQKWQDYFEEEDQK